MKCAGKCVLTEVRKSQERRCGDSSHSAHKRTFLRLEAVREYSLVSHKVKLFVAVTVVSLLEYSNVVYSALMEIAVVLGIHRVYLNANHAEVLPGKLASLTDVLDAAFCVALAGENEDLLHSAVSDDLHFMLYLLHVQLHAADIIIAVEAAVNAVVLAIIGDIQRSEQVDRIAEMLLSLKTCLLRHLLQERLCCWGKEGFEVLNGAVVMGQRSPYVSGSIAVVVVAVHLPQNLVHNVGLYLLHSLHVLHMVST